MPDDETKQQQLPPLRPGLRVRIHGLHSAKGRRMNGKIARVMSNQNMPDDDRQEGRVRLKIVGNAAGKSFAIKRSNLRTGDEAICAVCGMREELHACPIC